MDETHLKKQFTTADHIVRGFARQSLSSLGTPIVKPFVRFAVPAPARSNLAYLSRSYTARLRRPALQNICVSFADTQLVTRSLILFSLASSYTYVSQYKYFVGSHLAVLSLVAYQAISFTIVGILHNMPFAMRAWRLIWVVAILSGVTFSVVLEHSKTYGALQGSKPMACAVREFSVGSYTPIRAAYVILVLLVLLSGLFFNIAQLFPALGGCRIVQAPTKLAQTLLRWQAKPLALSERPSSSIYRLRNGINCYCWSRPFTSILGKFSYLKPLAWLEYGVCLPSASWISALSSAI